MSFNQDTNRQKDVMVNFKSTTLGKNSKGGDRFQFSLSQEQTVELYNAIGALLENPRGVKLDVHVGEKQTQDGSRSFLSGFTFVKPIGEPQSQASPQAPKRFVPATAASTSTSPVSTAARPTYPAPTASARKY